MSDKIAKELAKYTPAEKRIIAELLSRIYSGALYGLDVKKLKNFSDVYRVRKGRLRILYRKQGSSHTLLAIDRRDDKTYRNLTIS